MTPRILAIIQARMSSSRLPGKVLIPVAGKPLLQHMLERVRKSKSLAGILLATTIDPSDDILEEFAHSQGCACYRGSLPDVLDRFYRAAIQYHADVIVRLTADCPLIDPQVLDLTVAVFLETPVSQYIPGPPPLPGDDLPASFSPDFATNRMPPPWTRTLPIGLDVEVCSFAALERAWGEARSPNQREHVMPYLYEGISFPPPVSPPVEGWYVERGVSPRGFKVAHLNHAPDFGSLRWTVDTAADLEFIRQVFSHFEGCPDFSWQEVLALLNSRPELAQINAGVKHRSAFDVDERHQG